MEFTAVKFCRVDDESAWNPFEEVSTPLESILRENEVEVA